MDFPTPVRSVSFKGTISRSQFCVVQKILLPWWARSYVVVPVYFLLAINWTHAIKDPASFFSDLTSCSIFLGIFWGCVEYSRRSAWKKSLEFNGELSGAVDENGIEWHARYSVTKYPWEKLLKSKKASDTVVIFYSARCGFYFPRNFFASDEDWDLFQSIVASKLLPKRSVYK